ncbi:MAG: hypothetical protein BMS9Abin21_236 [Thermodesulfovibrionia bacterium]|nr:MAG: hypothetical protein BMS9Abin21_236 [Thermodesulfovibrionia bacterium]
MKKTTKLFSTIFVTLAAIVAFTAFLTKSINAQGTYTCVPRPPLFLDCGTFISCDTGCIPQPGACSGPVTACAGVSGECICGDIVNPLVSVSGTATSVVQKVIVNLVNLAYITGVVIFFFMLIVGGLQWIASGGDKMAVSNARSRIFHAIIGLLVLMAVFVIVRMVEEIFGVDLLKIDVGLISL